METLTAASTRPGTIHVATARATQFIDLTDRLERFVAESSLRTGILNIQTLHTTTAIVVNEHEPLLLMDFEALLADVAPADQRYSHDDTALRTVNVSDGEPPNGHSHCRALLLPTSVCLNVNAGQIILGRWQRVFFVELDGPRERQISVLAFGETGR